MSLGGLMQEAMHAVIRVLRACERPMLLGFEDSMQGTARVKVMPLCGSDPIGSHDAPAGKTYACTLHQQGLRCMGHLAMCGHLTRFATLQG